MFRFATAGLLLVASALAGCAQQRCAGVAGGGSVGPVGQQPIEMQTERGSLRPDLAAVVSYAAVDQVLGQPTPLAQYRVLRAEEVQCLAAANAPLGKLYASESEAVLANPGRCRKQQAAHTLSKLMTLRAIDERNKAAGSALELFYSLAETEASRDLLDRSIEEVDRAAAYLDQLKQSGLKIPMDRTALERQKLDWIDRRIQLYSALRKMQGQLQQLCGFEADETTAIWPQADLTVAVLPSDLQAAIAVGLANRADLGALRMLRGSLDSDTLPAARTGMQAMSPGLGASVITRRLLGDSSGGDGELQTRQSQLMQAQAEAEQNISREISEAVWNVETRLREIAVAKERWEVWQKRVAGLQERRQTDNVTAFDLSAAQLELLHAESDTVHRVIAWKIAQAKLKQAQGLLAAECGYRACQ
jgi:hypothetical protein